MPNTSSSTTPPLQSQSPQKKPSSLIHKTGYSGPASFGLLFFQQLKHGTITPTAQQKLYDKPLSFFLKLFQTYYQTPYASLPQIKILLSQLDVDTLQYTLAPLFRLALISLFHAKKTGTSQSSSFDDDFIQAPHHNDLLDQLITHTDWNSLMTIFNLSNTLHQFDDLLHRNYPFTPMDMLILSRLFHFQLELIPKLSIALPAHDQRRALIRITDRTLAVNRHSHRRSQRHCICLHIFYFFSAFKNDKNKTVITEQFDTTKSDCFSLLQRPKRSIGSLSAMTHSNPLEFSSQYLIMKPVQMKKKHPKKIKSSLTPIDEHTYHTPKMALKPVSEPRSSSHLDQPSLHTVPNPNLFFELYPLSHSPLCK